MSQSKYAPLTIASDESLYRSINCSSINHNLEATMLQDTIATTSNNESNSSERRLIFLEIIINVILIAIAVTVQFSTKTVITSSQVNLPTIVETNH